MIYDDELYTIKIDTVGEWQGDECFSVYVKERDEHVKIEIWDYDTLYRYPYLFEIMYQKILKSKSIYSVWDIFLNHKEIANNELRILDIGAGSGLAGQYIRSISSPQILHGLDILESARTSCLRDYPKIYDEYHVINLQKMQSHEKNLLKSKNFNCITIISSSGGSDDDPDYHDVELQEYQEIIDIINNSGYIVFNIREYELRGQVEIKKLLGKYCTLINETVYPHRQLLNGSIVNNKALIYRISK